MRSEAESWNMEGMSGAPGRWPIGGEGWNLCNLNGPEGPPWLFKCPVADSPPRGRFAMGFRVGVSPEAVSVGCHFIMLLC